MQKNINFYHLFKTTSMYLNTDAEKKNTLMPLSLAQGLAADGLPRNLQSLMATGLLQKILGNRQYRTVRPVLFVNQPSIGLSTIWKIRTLKLPENALIGSGVTM